MLILEHCETLLCTFWTKFGDSWCIFLRRTTSQSLRDQHKIKCDLWPYSGLKKGWQERQGHEEVKGRYGGGGRKSWGREESFNFSIVLSGTCSCPPNSTHLKECVQRPKRSRCPHHTHACLIVFPLKILNILEFFFFLRAVGKSQCFSQNSHKTSETSGLFIIY